MLNYDDILKSIKNKISSRNIKGNGKTVRVMVLNEIDELSNKQLKNLARSDNWLLEDSQLTSGRITNDIQKELVENLKTELKLDPQVNY